MSWQDILKENPNWNVETFDEQDALDADYEGRQDTAEPVPMSREDQAFELIELEKEVKRFEGYKKMVESGAVDNRLKELKEEIDSLKEDLK